MKRLPAILAILLSLYPNLSLSEERPYQLGRLVVTPSRIQGQYNQVARAVTILDEDLLKDNRATSISDLIGKIGGIDLRRRGVEGAQADINIRGATFEQNTVLVDGVKISDSQTGHYNLDLPLTMLDVERIEIMKGPASSLYGPNSFGGVINIITKKPDDKKVILNAAGGSYDYFSGGVSVTSPLGPFKNRLSFEERRSTGYRAETEFNIMNMSNKTYLETDFGAYDFLFGYAKKDFGADSFYSNLYANEEEHTDTRFFKIEGNIEKDILKIEPKLFLKRHRDKFALDRNRPGWQTNYHTTYNYGGEINFVLENPFLDTAYGFELSHDTIDSTNIGRHERTNTGIYIELSPKLFDDLYLNMGLREDYFPNFGWETSPSASASYALSDSLIFRSSIGRSYRIPTFTDLYYRDVANIGKSDLRPESSWSYDVGMDYVMSILSLKTTFFHRDSSSTIDWIRSSARDPWRVSNIGSIKTNGLEFSLEIRPKKIEKSIPIEKAFLDYTALDSYRKHDYLSKYALDYLKQHISAGLDISIGEFRNSWVLNYKKRIGDSGFIVVDTRISRDINIKDKIKLEGFIEISNLFDVEYSEQSDILMPGRWIKSGARLEF